MLTRTSNSGKVTNWLCGPSADVRLSPRLRTTLTAEHRQVSAPYSQKHEEACNVLIVLHARLSQSRSDTPVDRFQKKSALSTIHAAGIDRNMTMEGETYDWAGAGFLTTMADTFRFYRCLLYFLSGGTYKGCPYFASRLQVRRVTSYSWVHTPPPFHPLSPSV